MEHLSSLDASFVHLETPETPMHVASLLLLELTENSAGNFYEEVKKLLANRIHLARLLHRKLAPMPFELGDPVWIEDDDVDIDYHVRHVLCRSRARWSNSRRLTARLHSSTLDRSRPLWEVYVIEGLQDGLIGYYNKVHHSGIDGKSGTELANVLYDLTPEPRIFEPPVRGRPAVTSSASPRCSKLVCATRRPNTLSSRGCYRKPRKCSAALPALRRV